VLIEVADDGVGMGNRPASALSRAGAGIGMKNVRERLEVLYGNQARFTVVSNPGRGTLVSIEIPADLPARDNLRSPILRKKSLARTDGRARTSACHGRALRNPQPIAVSSEHGAFHGAGVGSKGNSTVVSGGRTRILVDCGLSCRNCSGV